MYRYRTAEAWLGRRCEAREQEWQLSIHRTYLT